MSPILYISLLVISCSYALYRGGKYERLVALVCIVGTIATVSVHSPLTKLYVNVERGALLVDAAVLLSFVLIALHSDRFWPLWVAGLQLTTSLAHFLKAMEPAMVPGVYGAAERFWSYPILIILFAGAWRTRQRMTASPT